MQKNISVFNDVIGPVMRGPSSSHTAASWRIARICLDILNEPLASAVINFDKDGAWASNYREQGTAMGIDGGLLGLDITDSRMKDTDALARKMGVKISYDINCFPTKHANTVRLKLTGQSGKTVQIVAVSTGGGAFEIQKIDEFDVNLHGDYFELLFQIRKNDSISKRLKMLIPGEILTSQFSHNNQTLVNLKSSNYFSDDFIEKLKQQFDFDNYCIVRPILPIVSGKKTDLKFNDIQSLLEFAGKNKLDLADSGLIYEEAQGGLKKSHLFDKMKDIVGIIDDSINAGLNGTDYKDRILQQQSHLIEQAEKNGKILQNSVVNKIVAYVTAIMEAKSAMEVIVANPTAGSCGTIGGVIKAVAEELNSTNEELINAYFAAGIIGVFFARGPGFSAEEHGCQVECGAASGMAAAGIVQLMGGSAKQAVNAASMAIQNMIGLVCDPVADRVEVPCLGKNINAAMNALSSATMACAGFDVVIPLEEVIQTVARVGEMMPGCVKCTGMGGLSITATSIQIKEELKKETI